MPAHYGWQVAGLAEMRNHNAALEQFVVTSDVPTAIGMETGSAVATVLASTAAGQKTAKRAADRRDKNLREFKGEAADLVEEPSTGMVHIGNGVPGSVIPSVNWLRPAAS
jgi:hypothetical protein